MELVRSMVIATMGLLIFGVIVLSVLVPLISDGASGLSGTNSALVNLVITISVLAVFLVSAGYLGLAQWLTSR